MWNTLSPQQQQFLMRMLQSQGGGGVQPGMMQQQAAVAPQLNAPGQGVPQLGMGQPIGNPLMSGGNSAVSPQQQAMMQQYMQLLGHPQGWGAAANGQPAVWQMLMGRSPWYGQGTAVP